MSAWLARRGARPVGIDNSLAHLEAARSLQDEFGLRFPLVQADAEAVPLTDESFDVAISEYGASIWCDPSRWVPEAARPLRPGGALVFLVNGTLLMLCVPHQEDQPAGDSLLRPYFGMCRFEWPNEECVDFHLGYGGWVRLLRRNGFEGEDLVELRPREGATTRSSLVNLSWAAGGRARSSGKRENAAHRGREPAGLSRARLTDPAALSPAWRYPAPVPARRPSWPQDQVRAGIQPERGSPAVHSKDRSRQRRGTSTA